MRGNGRNDRMDSEKENDEGGNGGAMKEIEEVWGRSWRK